MIVGLMLKLESKWLVLKADVGIVMYDLFSCYCHCLMFRKPCASVSVRDHWFPCLKWSCEIAFFLGGFA